MPVTREATGSSSLAPNRPILANVLKGAGTTELEPVASRVTGTGLGNVNLVFVGSVLAGSVPGSILDVYLSGRFRQSA